MEGLMAIAKVGERVNNVGFISTRIAGTDGVSLELEKWSNIFKKFGWTSYYFAGELDRPPQQSYRVEEAHFTHPEIKAIHDKAVELTRQVLDNTQLRQEMVDHDYELAKKYFSYTVLQQALRNYMVAHNWLAPGEC